VREASSVLKRVTQEEFKLGVQTAQVVVRLPSVGFAMDLAPMINSFKSWTILSISAPNRQQKGKRSE
jgi:hypothetical protein